MSSTAACSSTLCIVRIGQAEIDHRAELDQKAAVGGAAAGGQFGLNAGFLADR